MCLIACAFRAHPTFELILAGNRDEFHARPTAGAAAWDDALQVVGGRDLEAGGSWLALSGQRRLAAVTNVRRMAQTPHGAPSRGALVADFVRGDVSAAAAAQTLLGVAQTYAGFNLLLWDGVTLEYVSNRPAPRHDTLPPGIYGLSNDALDTPWPKLLRLRAAMHAVTAQQRPVDALFDALADPQPADAAELPDTGIGTELERFLSPPFIRDARYGTRASTVVTVPYDGTATLTERRFGPDGHPLGERTLKAAP